MLRLELLGVEAKPRTGARYLMLLDARSSLSPSPWEGDAQLYNLAAFMIATDQNAASVQLSLEKTGLNR
jgi:hypothetical protein